MRRRHFFQGAGSLAASGAVVPAISFAGSGKESRDATNLLTEINKKRLLADIGSRYRFGPELSLHDVEERNGQLLLTLQNEKLSFELSSPDHGLNWYTV